MRNRKPKVTGPAEPWLQVFEQHTRKQRQLIRDMEGVNHMLEKMDGVFHVLLNDEQFTTLLRAERLDQIPTAILTRRRL